MRDSGPRLENLAERERTACSSSPRKASFSALPPSPPSCSVPEIPPGRGRGQEEGKREGAQPDEKEEGDARTPDTGLVGTPPEERRTRGNAVVEQHLGVHGRDPDVTGCAVSREGKSAVFSFSRPVASHSKRVLDLCISGGPSGPAEDEGVVGKGERNAHGDTAFSGGAEVLAPPSASASSIKILQIACSG